MTAAFTALVQADGLPSLTSRLRRVVIGRVVGVASGAAGLVGAVVGAGGVAVVAVLALRAMGEWRTIQHRQQGRPDD